MMLVVLVLDKRNNSNKMNSAVFYCVFAFGSVSNCSDFQRVDPAKVHVIQTEKHSNCSNAALEFAVSTAWLTLSQSRSFGMQPKPIPVDGWDPGATRIDPSLTWDTFQTR